jgi:microcin C transport system permease protein
LALTIFGTVIGVLTGAIQGFFGGKVDLAMQRLIEIWSAMPELYLLIIFSAVFDPSISLLLILLGLFGWMDVLIIAKWLYPMNPYSMNTEMFTRIN